MEFAGDGGHGAAFGEIEIGGERDAPRRQTHVRRFHDATEERGETGTESFAKLDVNGLAEMNHD